MGSFSQAATNNSGQSETCTIFFATWAHFKE